MIRLLRYLFVVQHDYRDSVRATRARILLPLISVTGILALIYGVYVIAAATLAAGSSALTSEDGIAFAGMFIVLTIIALWLIQHGRVRLSATTLTALLLIAVLVGFNADGITPSAVLTLVPLLLFSGLAHGGGGIVAGLVLSWILLPGTAYLQSEGQLSAPVRAFDPLFEEALISAIQFTVSGAIFWVFTWNLQNVLTRTSRIAAQTRATATLGQALSRLLDIDELLTTAVDLIRDRFAYYHVQIFLLNDAGDYANLAASTGDTGITMLAQGFRVPVGSRTVVGDVAQAGKVIYVANIQQTGYQHAEALPDTRSELALPLIIGDDIIGVLDMQSARVNAFSNEDIEAMRIVANQVSQAVQNARLFESQRRSLLQNRRLFLESETNLHEIERLNRQLTAQSWEDYMLERNVSEFGIRISGDDVENAVEAWTPAMQQAMERQRPVMQKQGSEHTLAVPVVVRGQAIGAVEVQLGDHYSPAEAHSMLQAIVERMAFSLENARLFEQAHVAAEREQQINQIAAQLQGLTTVEDVMTTALSALSDALQAEYGAIRLAGREILISDAVAPLPTDTKRKTQQSPAAGNGVDQDKQRS